MKNRASRRRGFTLIEVLIVIAIIVALGALVTVNLMGGKKEAKVGEAQISMNAIKNSLDHFYRIYDRYPADEEGIRVLWSKEALTDQETDGAKWQKLLKDPAENDPWGQPWGYRQKSEQTVEGDADDRYDLWSNGPDRQEGTDDDLKSWKEDASGSGGSTATPSKTGG
jgi:general secretion pathway protein G